MSIFIPNVIEAAAAEIRAIQDKRVNIDLKACEGFEKDKPTDND
jgi:hypothetical protein